MTEPLLSIRGLVVQFGGLRAVDNFSMDVMPGTIHALIGPNGAGKSTVFNCVSQFTRASAGDMVFEGRSIQAMPAYAMAGLGIARTFQNIELCKNLTVLENVLIGMMPQVPRYFNLGPGSKRTRVEREAVSEAEALLAQSDLLQYRDTPAASLDFGHQKSLDLVRALASRPKLLLLDEPAAGLRNRELAKLDELLLDLSSKRGITILLVEHVMKLVMSVADTITVLSQGQKIAEGAPTAVRTNAAVIEAYLGRGASAQA